MNKEKEIFRRNIILLRETSKKLYYKNTVILYTLEIDKRKKILKCHYITHV